MGHVETEIPRGVLFNTRPEQAVEGRGILTAFPLYLRKTQAMFEHTARKCRVARAFAKDQEGIDFPCHRARLKSASPASSNLRNSLPVNPRGNPPSGRSQGVEGKAVRVRYIRHKGINTLLAVACQEDLDIEGLRQLAG